MQMMKRIILAALLVFACATAATSSAQAGPLGKVKTANGNFNGGAGNFAAGSSAAGNGTNGQHHGPSK